MARVNQPAVAGGRAVQPALWPSLEALDEDTSPKDGSDDDLLSKAIEVVRSPGSQGRASISLLQRRLHIGYVRAARIIELMEEHGVIGPDEGGGRARHVLGEASGPKG